MTEIEEKLATALEYSQHAAEIMNSLGHTKYTIGNLVSRPMMYDLEQEVGELLGKLKTMTAQRDSAVETLVNERMQTWRYIARIQDTLDYLDDSHQMIANAIKTIIR